MTIEQEMMCEGSCSVDTSSTAAAAAAVGVCVASSPLSASQSSNNSSHGNSGNEFMRRLSRGQRFKKLKKLINKTRSTNKSSQGQQGHGQETHIKQQQQSFPIACFLTAECSICLQTNQVCKDMCAFFRMSINRHTQVCASPECFSEIIRIMQSFLCGIPTPDPGRRDL